jgi:hypothetical protein
MGSRATEPGSNRGVLTDLDRSIRTIVGELAEEATRANMLWSRAVGASQVDPERAMTHLADLQVYLEIILPNQRKAILRATRAGLDALEPQTSVGDEPGVKA